MPSNQDPILKIAALAKSFNQNIVLDQINFVLNVGDILSVLGPSGCGKTTLLRLIAGFEQPQSGKIYIKDNLVASHDYLIPPEQRNVGMVFQDYALFPHLTVHDNIGFGLRRHPHRQQRVQEVLKLVNLEGLGRRYPDQLSGGQQQRVAVARAIAPNPALILLDEPLSNLDVQTRLKLRQELRDILKLAQISTIIVTHDQEEAMAISDQVAVMQSGKIEQFDSPEHIYQNPASKFVAEFVTQANFLTAHRQQQVWQTEIGSFTIAEPISEDHGIIMIRQEDIVLEPSPANNVNNFDTFLTIRDRVFVGRELIYCLRTSSGQDIFARSTDRLAIGTTVKLSVRSPKLQVFTQP